MGHDRLLTGLEAGLAAEILGRIGLRAAGQPLVIERRRLHRHQPGRFQLAPAFRQRMLDRLIGADRTVKNDAVLGVLHRAGQRVLPNPDAFDTDQYAFGVEAVQQIAEALAFFANEVFQRYRQAVDEHLVRVHRLAPHLGDFAYVAMVPVEIGIEEAESFGRFGAFLDRRRPHQQHDFLGFLRRRCPDLLAVNDIAIAAALSLGLDLRRVQSGVRFRHPETGNRLALNQVRQPAALLLVIAENDDRVRPEDVDVDRRGRAHRAGRFRHRVHQDGGFGHAEIGAAIFLGHGHAKPAGLRHRLVEIVRKLAGFVPVQPIIVVEAGAQAFHILADRLLFGREYEIHSVFPCVLSVGPDCKDAGRRAPLLERTANYRAGMSALRRRPKAKAPQPITSTLAEMTNSLAYLWETPTSGSITER
jgi:hypothetical protein